MSGANLTQCLLFFVHERRQGVKAPSTSSLKFYALLPETFKTELPEIVGLFLANDIVIMSSTDVLSLQFIGRDEIEVIEMVLCVECTAAVIRLSLVVEEMNVPIVERLVFSKTGIDVNVNSKVTGVRPAINDDNISIIKQILSYGTNIRCRHPSEESLLHLAARRGHETLAQAILEQGVDVNLKSRNGMTPLFLAVCGGHCDIVDALLRNGADIEGKTKNRSVLHHAVENGHADVVKILLRNGSNIESKSYVGSTALHAGVSKGYRDIVEILLQYGADIENKTKVGLTALFLAVEKGYLGIIELLLQNGAYVDCKDLDGRTPLFIAAEKRQLKIVELLLSYDARLDIKLTNGKFAVEAIFVDDRHEMIDCILDSSFNDPELGKETGAFGRLYNFEPALFFSHHLYARHLSKIIAANLYPLNLPSRMSHVIQDDFKVECESEVSQMKRLTVGNSNITFFDVLTKDVTQVACYLRNSSVADVLSSIDHYNTFPWYSSILDRQFEKGKVRKLAMEEGVKTIDNVALFCKLPLEIKERILDYLSLRDIIILKRACTHNNL